MVGVAVSEANGGGHLGIMGKFPTSQRQSPTWSKCGQVSAEPIRVPGGLRATAIRRDGGHAMRRIIGVVVGHDIGHCLRDLALGIGHAGFMSRIAGGFEKKRKSASGLKTWQLLPPSTPLIHNKFQSTKDATPYSFSVR